MALEHHAQLKELVGAFNAHDLDRIMAFFSEDCVLETPRGQDPWGTRFEGRAAVREGLTARFEGLPDVHYGDDEHWVCGDHAVSKWFLTGTTLDGQQVRVRGCDLFDLASDGRVTRKERIGRSSRSDTRRRDPWGRPACGCGTIGIPTFIPTTHSDSSD